MQEVSGLQRGRWGNPGYRGGEGRRDIEIRVGEEALSFL